uniref:Geranylgeranyl transferase type II subunit beta n=1 Tax=Chromera velia CCMP2878 TaxID=1169474 RepID=A0A0G4HUE0_9ALVE|eukprot:Cvel_8638.t1-p1 / transcript=Cvel_8638.t1 / gene=Cvel_8638 / organism=Chromera_velia_CCMP2878 / gene_product=Probable geranylgeranyl transferase type-2 subunit, putative / transcript_product=Probable geranylgeranyl transferase type-2 subunit, putative / location=Cvel_scaffold481:29087-32437(-) / protein_length=504 / sequence_SO=supercontig / SO=protein_coding / is_pseudo=false
MDPNLSYLLNFLRKCAVEEAKSAPERAQKDHTKHAGECRQEEEKRSSGGTWNIPQEFVETEMQRIATESFFLSGVYWTLCGISLFCSSAEGFRELLVQASETSSESIAALVRKCARADGGFAPSPDPVQSAHVLSTLSAVQVDVILRGHTGAVRAAPSSVSVFGHEAEKASTMSSQTVSVSVCREKTVAFCLSLQHKKEGFFAPSIERPGDSDVRFTYCALATLTLLGANPCAPSCYKETNCKKLEELTEMRVEWESLRVWLWGCLTEEGGFGASPGDEAHAGHTFCALASLALIGGFDSIPFGQKSSSSSSPGGDPGGGTEVKMRIRKIWRWLSRRQHLTEGGLTGRPSKHADVCYTWWVLASLSILLEYGVRGDIPRTFYFGGEETVGSNGGETASGAARFPSSLDLPAVHRFIQESQRPQKGGIARDPAHQQVPDPFHTFLGLAGLSLIRRQLQETERNTGAPEEEKGKVGKFSSRIEPAELQPVDPLLALPARSVVGSVR